MFAESDPLLTVAQVLEKVPVSLSTVRRWIREGKIEVVHLGPTNRIRIRLSELRRHYQDLDIKA